MTVVEGAGSYVVGEETALLSCLQGLRGTVSARPPFPAERGVHGMPTVVNNVETLCNIPFIAVHGAEAYRALSPDATPGSKIVCFNERFAKPGAYEVPFGMTMRELCEDVAGGMASGRPIKALQIGGPLGGILPGWKLDTVFDFEPLAAEGCMVGHGGIVAFEELTDMRAVAKHLLHFGAAESCGKCFPCRIGLTRAHAMFENNHPVDRAKLEQLLEALELGSLCAHGGGMPAPIRSLLAHFPEELGLDVITFELDGEQLSVAPGTTVLDAARAAGHEIPTLCFDERQAPFGACRVCLVGVEGAPGPVASCTTIVREGMKVDTLDPTARRVAAAVVELVLSELPVAARRAHRAGRGRADARRRRAALARPAARGRARRAPSVPRLPARALHLLRALRARVRRGPGHVRADRDRPRLQREHRRRAGRRLPRLGLRLLRRLRRHLPDGRHHRDLAATPDRARTREVSTMFDSTVTTTCGYCGVGCRLEAHARDGKVASISPALDGPANEGHTCLKGRFAHQFSRRRDRLDRAR